MDKWLTKKNISLFFFTLIFFVAPFYYQPNIGGEGLNLPANVTIWLAAVIFISVSLFVCIKDKAIKTPKKMLLILAFPILATTSAFVTGVEQPTEWLFRFLYIWMGVLFLISLYQISDDNLSDTLLVIISISGFLHAIVAITQIFQPEGTVIWIPTPAQALYPVGMFQQVNNHASFQATVLLVNWYLITTSKVQSNKGLLSSILLSTVLASFIIFASGSRVGLLGMLVGLVAILFMLREHYFKNTKKHLVLILASTLLGLVVSTQTDGLSRVSDKASLSQTEYSNSARLGIYAIAAELINEKPVFGYGIGSFRSVWQYQKAEYQSKHPEADLIGEYVTHPHNELIFWQVEGGSLATLGILISAFTIIYFIFRSSKNRYVLALLMPVSLHLLVELPFYTSALHWLLFLTLIAIGLSELSRQVQIKLSSLMNMTSYMGLGGLIIISIVFSIQTLHAGAVLNAAIEGENIELKPAMGNIYFSNIAEDFYMQNMFMLANEHKSEQVLRDYIFWAEKYIQTNPSYLHIKYLIASYQTLGMTGKACDLAQTASMMYRKNNDFQVYEKYCQTIN